MMGSGALQVLASIGSLGWSAQLGGVDVEQLKEPGLQQRGAMDCFTEVEPPKTR